MKYINIAILVLGLILGAFIGSTIPLYNGNAALIGALLVPAFGFLLLHFLKRSRRVTSIEEGEQQSQLAYQQNSETHNLQSDLVRYARKFYQGI